MKEPSETVSESVKYLGQGFLLAYYLPALAEVLNPVIKLYNHEYTIPKASFFTN
jgi:hypothetical protein